MEFGKTWQRQEQLRGYNIWPELRVSITLQLSCKINKD